MPEYDGMLSLGDPAFLFFRPARYPARLQLHDHDGQHSSTHDVSIR
jgi:hypothetical protein